MTFFVNKHNKLINSPNSIMKLVISYGGYVLPDKNLS